MSLFAILHSGASALSAQSRALQTTANNVANVETAGYTRQSTDLRAAGTLNRSGLLLGQGVSAGTVTSAYDVFAQGQVLDRQGQSGYARAHASGMQAIEVALAEGEDGALGQRLAEFFDSFEALEASPNSSAVRLDVLGKAELLAGAFNRAAEALEARATSADLQVGHAAGRVNELSGAIAALNSEITQLEAGGGQANDLRVQRSNAIEELSKLASVRSSEQSDGSVNVLFAGHQLVEGSVNRTIAATEDPVSGHLQLRISHGTSTFDITGALGDRGELGAALTMRDEVVPDLLSDLDLLAEAVITEVNTVHAAGHGLDGSTGLNLFDPVAASGAAAAFSVNVAVANSPDSIAAAGSAGTLPGGNTNAAALAGLAGALTMSGGTRTFESFYGQVLADLGGAASTAYAEEGRTAIQLDAALDARDAKTAVSLEEEAIDLIRFQEAYQAAARVVSTANELFDDLLSIVR